jgi:pyruvate/oxaloacetate carboxyltransferase
MDHVHFVDTTIRDGHQSLWAERMATGMMLPIAKNLNEAGFEAIELLSGSHIKKAMRALSRYADAIDRRTRQHLRVRSALHVRIVHRSDGCERHPAGAHLRTLE